MQINSVQYLENTHVISIGFEEKFIEIYATTGKVNQNVIQDSMK